MIARRRATFTVTAALAVAALAAASSVEARVRRRRRIEVQGHRGARARRPENTMSAFRYALRVGVDTLELDVVITRDDEPVVTHDLILDRTRCRRRAGKALVKLGKRPVAVRSLTLAQLRRYNCATVRHARFAHQRVRPAGESIPTLDEVLALARRAKRPVHLNIEAKRVPGRPDLAPPPRRFVRLIASALRKHKLTSRATLQSFDHRVLRVARRLAPKLTRVALVAESHPDYVALARAAGAAIVSPHHLWLDARDVKAIHAAGLRVIPWTVNDVKGWRRLVRLGVDGIISDDPAALIRYLRKRGLR